MAKRYIEQDVLSAAEQRIKYTFDNFEKVYVSFSAGKDSTVMLHLVMKEAVKRNVKIGLLLLDLEGQYKLTIDHAIKTYEKYKDNIIPYWVCLPISLRNAVSVFEPKWIAWDQDKKDAWIRTPPDIAIVDKNYFPFYKYGMEFEEFVPKFGEWFSEEKSCACFVGIRSDESLNRYRTIASKTKTKFKDKIWTSKITDNVYNAYPIYDWKTEDLWTWHYKYPHDYNQLYDRMFQAGLSVSQMRICQPYGDDQRRGLWLFHIIEPESWAKIVYRVNGANSGSLYIKEWGNINGYKRVNKPSHLTWKEFATLIIETLPPQSSEHYKAKIFVFQEWWQKKGYPNGIPDEADYALEVKKLAPSWRRVCKSLLRNDYWMKGLSFTQHKSAAYNNYIKLIQKKIKDKEDLKNQQITFEV